MSCLVNGYVLPMRAAEEGSGDGRDLLWRVAALGVFDKNCRSRVFGVGSLGGEHREVGKEPVGEVPIDAE